MKEGERQREDEADDVAQRKDKRTKSWREQVLPAIQKAVQPVLDAEAVQPVLDAEEEGLFQAALDIKEEPISGFLHPPAFLRFSSGRTRLTDQDPTLVFYRENGFVYAEEQRFGEHQRDIGRASLDDADLNWVRECVDDFIPNPT